MSLAPNGIIPSLDQMMLITCVLYRGGSSEVMKALHRRGLNSAYLHHARGSAIGDPIGKDGLPNHFEKEIVSVVVPQAQSDEVFEFIFDTAQIDRPHGGFLYMERLRRAGIYTLPNLPEDKAA
jgi:nitrogen regulatory protein PII